RKYVVSGFSRTVSGPPEGGHYIQMENGLTAGIADSAWFDKLTMSARPEPVEGCVLRGKTPFSSHARQSFPGAQELVHDGRRAIPLGFLRRELAPSGGGDRVVPRFPVVVADAPLRAHQPALLQTH